LDLAPNLNRFGPGACTRYRRRRVASPMTWLATTGCCGGWLQRHFAVLQASRLMRVGTPCSAILFPFPITSCCLHVGAPARDDLVRSIRPVAIPFPFSPSFIPRTLANHSQQRAHMHVMALHALCSDIVTIEPRSAKLTETSLLPEMPGGIPFLSIRPSITPLAHGGKSMLDPAPRVV
jgi:hypothetical protein